MPKTFLRRCKAFLLDIFFPNRCPFCNEIIKWDKSVCNDCGNKLIDANEKICHKCGNVNCECSENYHFDSVYASLFFDDENVSSAIYDFKHTGMSNIATYTAEQLMKYNLELNADMVTGVPMGKYKQQMRGHNQADILAKCVGEYLNIPFKDNLLYKLDTKEEQHLLSAEQRKEHVKELFHGSDTNLDNKTIILCDDVMTTGATLNTCSEILKDMGADKVIICVCAVTRADKSQEEG